METPQPKQPKQLWGLSYTEIGIIVVLLCVICSLLGFLARGLISRTLSELTSENNSSPTQKARPNYKQMLEANGFAYYTDNEEGDPIYVSPCGCVATVNPSYMGFAANYDPNNDCPIRDMGAIISVMYPSEVFDFVVANMNSVIVQDTTVHGTAAGYRINIDFDPYDPKLIMTIEDPQ